MRQEKSCGAIVYYEEDGSRKYLLLHYAAGHWDFPKGHVEKGEEERETVARELREETGIDAFEFIDGFREEISYCFKEGNELVSKTVVFYLIKSKNKRVKLSFEHKGYAWLNFEDAKKRVTYKNAREVLVKAHELLKQRHFR
jgi:8-oxo-dGTP pyrophosphatase MutT (NUDIX family)